MKNFINNMMNNLYITNNIRYTEGANMLISALMRSPAFSDKVSQHWYHDGKKTKVLKIVSFVIDQIYEFLKKLLFVAFFVYLPYRILGSLCPNIHSSQERTSMYMFLIMSTFCGSLVNGTIAQMTDRDYLMLRIMRLDPDIYYRSRIFNKMIMEFVYTIFALRIFGLGFRYAIPVSFITIALRPVGELVNLYVHDKMNWLYQKKGTVHGLLMVLAFIIAYIVPYINRNVSTGWNFMNSILAVILFGAIGAYTVYRLLNYTRFADIAQENIYLRRQEQA